MYNNAKYNCGCGNMMGGAYGCGYNMPAPIVAPKRVCVTQSNRYVEQPVICPIENRHIQNLRYYPRYYPRYEQTYATRDCGNYVAMAANGSGFNAASQYDGYGANCNCGKRY